MNKGQRESLDVSKKSNRLGFFNLGTKFALMGAGSVLITALALVIIAIWQSEQYNKYAQKEVNALIDTDLRHLSKLIYNLIHAENDAMEHQVENSLNIASGILAQKGTPSLSNEHIEWEIQNPVTNKRNRISIPKFLVGGKWIRKDDDFSLKNPVLDEIKRFTGETVSIFQRIDDEGDMLRIATDVDTNNKNRVVGTVMPFKKSDGTDNPIIKKILNGDTYRGRISIENEWYFCAYSPIYDTAGTLIGMLNIGINQKTAESRIRHAILETNVGKSGYVYVLEGSGANKGRYIISYRGKRDGENVWAARDSDGRYVIRELIKTATALKPGEMATIRYRWQNPGEPSPRWQIANLVYFAPWDWVIGTSVYEDELQTYNTRLKEGRRTMVDIMGTAGIIITLIVVLTFIFTTFKKTRPVKDMTKVAQKIMKGDLDQFIDVKSRDEIGILAETFNLMTGKLKESIDNLSRSEEKYRGIFQNAVEGLFQKRLDGSILSANPAMARLLGYDSPEDLIQSVTDVKKQLYVDPEDRDRLVDILKKTDEVSDFELQFYKKNREKIWVSISARLRHLTQGAPPLIEGFIINISDRKQAEEALAASINYLDEILNAVADPVFVKDDECKLVLVNNAMCDFIGRPRNAILGKTDFDFFIDEEAGSFQDSDKKVLETGEESINEETFTDSDNNIRIVISKKTLYIDKNGKKFIVGIIRDVTEQKAAEEEKFRLEARLTQSQKMEAIGTLAGGIAHDFNNILSAIIGYTELAMHEINDEDRAKESLTEVLRAGERARELIKQILTFSRMDESEHHPVMLDRVMKDSLKMLRAVIPSNIIIKQDINVSGYILSNSTQINQIMLKLCSNAFQSMSSAGGTLEVGLGRVRVEGPDNPYGTDVEKGSYLRITISDTGKDITPEMRERIFEPYFSTKENGAVTGPGLSVIHGIVKSHNGDIICKGNVSGGTTFEIYLPEQREMSKIEELPEAELEKGAGRILVIDDDPILVKLLVEMLGIMGYEAESSTNSKKGLKIFKDAPKDFDLVITDMTMPELNGDALAREILSVRNNMPIVLCTGYNEHISEAQAKEIGITEFLMKPVNMKMLSSVLHNVLGR